MEIDRLLVHLRKIDRPLLRTPLIILLHLFLQLIAKWIRHQRNTNIWRTAPNGLTQILICAQLNSSWLIVIAKAFNDLLELIQVHRFRYLVYW